MASVLPEDERVNRLVVTEPLRFTVPASDSVMPEAPPALTVPVKAASIAEVRFNPPVKPVRFSMVAKVTPLSVAKVLMAVPSQVSVPMPPV